MAFPLLTILQQVLMGKQGELIWFDSFIACTHPPLLQSLWNSLWVSVVVTLVAVSLAFGFAYALTRSCIALKSLFRCITRIPLLAAISLRRSRTAALAG